MHTIQGKISRKSSQMFSHVKLKYKDTPLWYLGSNIQGASYLQKHRRRVYISSADKVLNEPVSILESNTHPPTWVRCRTVTA